VTIVLYTIAAFGALLIAALATLAALIVGRDKF